MFKENYFYYYRFIVLCVHIIVAYAVQVSSSYQHYCIISPLVRNPPPPTTQDKVLLYTIYVAGKNDIEVQRKGLVAIIWVGANNSDCTNNSVTSSSSSKNTKQRDLVKHILLGTSNKSFHKTVSIRFIGYHICTPNSSAYKLLGSIIAMAIHKKNRSKLRIHSGKHLQLYTRVPYGYRPTTVLSLSLSLTHSHTHTHTHTHTQNVHLPLTLIVLIIKFVRQPS